MTDKMTKKQDWNDDERMLEIINSHSRRINIGDRVYVDLSTYFETDAGCDARRAECIVTETFSDGKGHQASVQVWCHEKWGSYDVDPHLVTLRFKAVYVMPE